MDDDFVFSGFFALEEERKGRVLLIYVHPDVTDYEQLDRRNEWYHGDLFVKADGSYVEINLQHVYDVSYTWELTTAKYLDNLSGLLSINKEPIVEKAGWFSKETRVYYPENTRYIRDVTKDHATHLRYLDHSVKLHTYTRK